MKDVGALGTQLPQEVTWGGLGLASLGWTVCMGRPHCSQQRAPPTSGRLAQGVGGAEEAPSGGAEGQWGWLWPPVVSMFPPPAPRQEIARQLGPETDSEALGSVFCTSGAAFPLWAKAALGGCSCPRPVSTPGPGGQAEWGTFFQALPPGVLGAGILLSCGWGSGVALAAHLPRGCQTRRAQ